MTAPKIITEHVRQPVNEGRGDWVAIYEDDETSEAAGFGRTEEEAVADLTAKFPVEENGNAST